jgi:hypothetical protein
VDRFPETEATGIHADGNGIAGEAATSIRKNRQDVLKRFEDARRTRRRQNQHLAKVKITCEALLAGQWLSANVGSLVDAFNVEPAAFVFKSSVPFGQPEAPKKPDAPRAPTPPPTAKPTQKEEGVLRSLFRWLFG